MQSQCRKNDGITVFSPAIHRPKVALDSRMALCYELMRRSGLRISEMLAVRYKDCLPNGYIHAKGGKHSEDRFFYAEDIYHKLGLLAKHKGKDLLFTFTRFQYYRWCRKNFSISPEPGKKNSRVTHATRAVLINQLLQAPDASRSSVSRFIGHRSNKTLTYYSKE